MIHQLPKHLIWEGFLQPLISGGAMGFTVACAVGYLVKQLG